MLLYATSKRGRVLESMYVRLRRGESTQNFSVWVYGDNQLARGSGLFVGEDGVVCNHHFLLPKDGSDFAFRAGDYRMDVFGVLAGVRDPLLLSTLRLQVPQEFGEQLADADAGIYFDWGPDSKRYHSHIDTRPKQALPPDVLQALTALGSVVSPNSPKGDPSTK